MEKRGEKTDNQIRRYSAGLRSERGSKEDRRVTALAQSM